MSADEQAVKQAKAKLYNLKSSIDGMIPLVEEGILSPVAVADGVRALSVRFYDDMNRNPS